jgi:VWFA-related protein
VLRPITLIFLAIVASAQEPVFRTGARLVTVDVVVHNNQGPVKSLTKEDFTLQDKGKTQTISLFSMTDSAAPAPKQEPLGPGIVSNRITSSGDSYQSATVILFDRLNIPRPLDQAAVRIKVLEFLASLKPTDRVGFYSLGTGLTMVEDFNEAAGPMAQAAKHLASANQPAPSDPRGQEVEASLKEALTPTQQLDMRVRTSVTVQALQTIARHLAGVPGRKNLVWVLSDFPLTYGETPDRRTEYESEVSRAGNILAEANIAAYLMDPRGVTISGSSTSGSDGPGTTSATEGGLMPKGRGAVAAPSQSVGLSGTETVDMIAKITGGNTYHQTNDIGADVRKVMEETQVTYMLGFYVEEKALDGKSHDLNIKLAKKTEANGATLRYRKNYLALPSKQQPHPAMNDLVDDPFEATAIGVMAVAVPDSSKPDVDKVQVRVDLNNLQFEHRADKWIAAFDLGLAMEGIASGPPVVSNKSMSLNLTDEQLKQGLNAGLIVDNTVPSPPKPTRLRVVVQDRGSGLAGSVRVPIAPR